MRIDKLNILLVHLIMTNLIHQGWFTDLIHKDKWVGF